MTLSRILSGHVIDILKDLAANWFHAIMTSPPYWQLRDYKTPHQLWPATLPGLQYTGKGDKLKAIESIIVKLEATLTGFLEVLEKA